MAAQLLVHHDFREVYYLEGGMEAWEGLAAAGPQEFHLQFVRGDETVQEIIAVAYNMERGLRDFHEEVRSRTEAAYVLLQFSDNLDWVLNTVLPRIETEFPAFDLVLHPLSLTAGTHMGPGTWAMAYLPFDAHTARIKMPSLHIMDHLKKSAV